VQQLVAQPLQWSSIAQTSNQTSVRQERLTTFTQRCDSPSVRPIDNAPSGFLLLPDDSL
jgi:hypothetical protein